MLQQALAATGLLVVLVMAADMLLVALHQRGWLQRLAAALQREPCETRARVRRREAARLQRMGSVQVWGSPASGVLVATAGRHNPT